MGNVKDIDGNSYKTVKIGDQLWMAENLKVTRYRNGDSIPNITDADDSITEEGAYCNYDNDESNVKTYGRLYNWFAVDDKRGLAPKGWHIPTDDEIKELEMYLGMSQEDADGSVYRGTDEGSKLAGRADLWNGGDLKVNPEFGTSGFNLLPGGCRGNPGAYYDMGAYGSFWSSTESNSGYAWHRKLHYFYSEIFQGSYSMKLGYSIRCLKD